MEQVYVREANSEVLVLIDKNMGNRLNALMEAEKILAREIIREKTAYERLNPNGPTHI